MTTCTRCGQIPHPACDHGPCEFGREEPKPGVREGVTSVREFLAARAIYLSDPTLRELTAIARAAVNTGDALDAARWRRLVNASELPFPVATIADDPENDCTLIYGRERLEALIDSYDEISDAARSSISHPERGGV